MGSPDPQEKAIVSGHVHRTFGLWFPFFRWMAQTLPRVAVQRLALCSAERAIWERDHVREAILDNFSRVLGLPPNDRRVEEAGREMVSQHSRFWIDLLRYSAGGVSPAGLIARREGDELLVEARREGRGVILLTAHVGNFEIGGLFLKDLGFDDVSVVYAPDPSPVIEGHRERARRDLDVKGIPATRSPFAFVPILKALERNGLVAIQGDRDVSGTGRRLPFFGEPTSFPEGPFQLAALSGAPVFPSFVLVADETRYDSLILPPIRVPRTRERGEREAAIRHAMEQWVTCLEGLIRLHPTQWYHFQRFWEL